MDMVLVTMVDMVLMGKNSTKIVQWHKNCYNGALIRSHKDHGSYGQHHGHDDGNYGGYGGGYNSEGYGHHK